MIGVPVAASGFALPLLAAHHCLSVVFAVPPFAMMAVFATSPAAFSGPFKKEVAGSPKLYFLPARRAVRQTVAVVAVIGLHYATGLV